MACEFCNEKDEAIDLLCKELDKQRRQKRELIRTIRLLKQSIIRELEDEHEEESQTHDVEYVTTGTDTFKGTIKYEVKSLSQADGHAEN